MTILELIAQWTGLAGPALVALLTAAGEASPDLKPTADDWIAKLNVAISPLNLAALVGVLPAELMDMLRRHFNPKDHPSDAI